MNDVGDDLITQGSPPQLDRRQLLRTGGLGLAVGAAGLLLPGDADARRRRRRGRLQPRPRGRKRGRGRRPGLGFPKWLDVELQIANFESINEQRPRPINVEIWSSDDGDSWSRSTSKTIPPDGKRNGPWSNQNLRKFLVPNKYIVAWIDDKYLAWAHNPLFGYPEAALGYGGRFDANGWQNGTLVDRDRGGARMVRDGIYFEMFRTDDSDDAKVYVLRVYTTP